MDGSRELCEESESSALEVNEFEAEELSPYDSDTEDIDLDEFVSSLPHNVNDWAIYEKENFSLEKIGNGFFGEIYKATEPKTNHVLVMKMMRKASKMKLMCAEIRLMCRLNHPNILRFLGVCIDSSGIHLVTAYMDIGNLEEVVADAREPLPWSLRMKLAHDISKGMAYLHAVGVIHRDLASKNILISNESGGYLAVVGDFGLAAKIPSSNTKLNVVGSPYWMAPEVLRNDQYNETVDIFSYGIILCEIIGRVHSSPDEIPRTNQYGLDVDKFRELVEGCPPEFLQLAVCCCQLDSQSRPPFEVTAKFLEFIRQLTIVEGSPIKLTPRQCEGNKRMSANIEDWIMDSKRGAELSPTKSFPPCDETCVCADGIAIVINGAFGKDKLPEEEKPVVGSTPCRRGHSNKRSSFFSGIRYKYFKPTVVTEDLVKNTPSKLAGFFNRVLHVQKKHKFDGRKKRSKTTSDVPDASPKLRSFRLFGTPKDKSASDVQTRPAVNVPFDGTNGGTWRPSVSHDDDNQSSSSIPEFAEVLPNNSSKPSHSLTSDMSSEIGERSSRRNSSERSCTTSEQSGAISPLPFDDVELHNGGSSETNDPFLMSWPQTSLRQATGISSSTDLNGFCDIEKPIPRCRSESDVCANNEATSGKARSFSTYHYPKTTKNKKYWNFLNFFQKRGKEKQNTVRSDN